MSTPSVRPDGYRQTINSDLDKDETIWHLRSAWNVAALNCLGATNQPVLDGYKWFLGKYKKSLAKVNTAIDRKFRNEYGSYNAALKARQAHTTQLYNYFAMPPVLPNMCKAALAVASDAQQNSNQDLGDFALANLPRFEAPYENFFEAYDQYRTASMAWDEKYGARYGYSQPGYVAVHGSAQTSIASSLNESANPPLAGTVTDPETGVEVPVVRQSDQRTAIPVVQPIPKDAK